jgi:hypothetical protein
MMHVGLGRKHPLHIEYVHLGACLGFIQDIMNEAILSHPRLHIQRKIALVKALNKVIWVQNDLMAKWHVKDGAEFETPDSDIEIEREGYLHGKKILEDDDMKDTADSNGSPDGEESKSKVVRGTCPFSGVSAAGASVKHDSEETAQ